MWVMTSWGILMPGLRPDGTVDPGDDRTLQVRARRARDLDILRDRYMPNTLGDTIALPGTDYQYRAYCRPKAWGEALAQIGAGIDYVKFKETAVSRFGDWQLHDLYLRIWFAVNEALSPPRPGQEEQLHCCALGLDGHDGPCGAMCVTCGGTGVCPVCEGTGAELAGCPECDSAGTCPAGCDDGWRWDE